MASLELGYIIVYVPSVQDALDFWGRAFGLTDTFQHPGGDYGEIRTGGVRLSFTAHELAAKVVPFPYQPASRSNRPGIELTLVTDDVDAAYARAVEAGAEPLGEPHDEPWGQRVAYVADLNGVGVGLASPMG